MADFIMREFGGNVLISSGAIGTCLRKASGRGDEPVELLNLRQPETVRSLHTAYRTAGSRILVTNTLRQMRWSLAMRVWRSCVRRQTVPG